VSDNGGGLRERTRRAVQRELLLVALDLFAAQGFERTTVDQIASAAGLSRRSFFRYFGTKEEVLTETLAVLGRRLADGLAARPPDEAPWLALRRSFDGLIDEMSTDSRALVMTRLMLDAPALQASHLQKVTSWRTALAAALGPRLGGTTSDDDRRLQADAISGAALACLMAAQEEWVRTDGGRPLADLVDATMAAVARPAPVSSNAQAAARDRP
jgi:AcrR family transcriptional regulator